MIHGFIRDYFGYGFARLEIYFLLTLSYAMLGISTPGSSDALQYFWIIQFGCIIAGSLNGKQFFTLFPNQFGFLIGNDLKDIQHDMLSMLHVLSSRVWSKT